MAYEKKTGLVDLEKLENDSDLMRVTGGTAKNTKVNCVPSDAKSFCVIRSKVYLQCWETVSVDNGPAAR